MDPSIFIIAGGILLLLGGAFFFDRLLQSPNDYKDKIIANLEAKGYTLVDIRIPKIFQTSPFPKFEIKIQPIQTKVLGVSGEKTRFRIVRFKDKEGLLRESWIEIEIVAFMVSEIKWEPEL